MNVDHLILGGGLAGLSTAYHLKSRSHLVVEKESETGGTARSFSIGGFTFDFTGHLLHLHHPYTRRLITGLLKGQFYECQRNTVIFSEGVTTAYPYQANTFGLPQNSIDRCVLGFLKAYIDNQKRDKNFHEFNFEKWSREIFGDGIAEKFLIPYNQKLYQIPPKKMTVDWCGRFVPKPKLEDVIRGALTPLNRTFGYNVKFLYPKKGGIQELARQLTKKNINVALKTSIKWIDWKNKIAELSDGRRVSYQYLVNTIPLKEFMKLVIHKSPKIHRAEHRLRHVSILCLNIGVERAHISERSWIYFPEHHFPFYRVGFPMNFTPHVVPKGCSSMYVEVPMNRVKGHNKKTIVAQVRNGLVQAGILKKSDRLPVIQYLPIPYAYVCFDRDRRKSLETLFSFLDQQNIQSIGRYGAWKYSFMEEAILDGKKAADNIKKGRWKTGVK